MRIEEYMSLHQQDENANQIWLYICRGIEWMESIFPVKMKGIEWGLLYNRFKDTELDLDALKRQIKTLLIDDEVTNKKDALYLVLTGEKKYLSLRAFTTTQKREAYERQGGVSVPENCKMRCRKCNRRKSDT